MAQRAVFKNYKESNNAFKECHDKKHFPPIEHYPTLGEKTHTCPKCKFISKYIIKDI